MNFEGHNYEIPEFWKSEFWKPEFNKTAFWILLNFEISNQIEDIYV